jgi:hypothetical protein
MSRKGREASQKYRDRWLNPESPDFDLDRLERARLLNNERAREYRVRKSLGSKVSLTLMDLRVLVELRRTEKVQSLCCHLIDRSKLEVLLKYSQGRFKRPGQEKNFGVKNVLERTSQEVS